MLCGGFLRLPVDLGHEERLLTVAVAQCLAHADFAPAVVVVPAVVEEGDAAVEGGADDADALLLIGLHAEVVAAEADHGDFLAGAAERARGNGGFGGVREVLAERGHECGGCGGLEEASTIHGGDSIVLRVGQRG